MTLLADPSIRETRTGMELEMVWSDDETMVALHVAIPTPGYKLHQHKLVLSALQLDELREFISANLT